MCVNVLLRDLDLHAPIAANGRSKWQDGWPLFGGAQLAVDTTLVSALHWDGTARRGAAHNEGVAISMAWQSVKRNGIQNLLGVEPDLVWWFWLLKSEAGGLLLHSILSALLPRSCPL